MHRVVPLLVLLGACAPALQDVPATPQVPSSTASSTTTSTTTPPSLSPLTSQVVPLGSAIYDPSAIPPPAPAPISVTIDGVPISDAPVVAVGVEPNGELEIPGATEVGWYRFGPTPRESGSAVFAAHIAFNGRNGVFRPLADVEPGAVVTVEYQDGSSSTHVVTEIAQYSKADLPLERVFSKTGDPVLTLITCGGAFNRTLNAYDDNVVVYAVPAP